MTIKHLFNTLDFASYDQICVHWPMANDNMANDNSDKEYHDIIFEYAEPLIELFGHINIMTIDETLDYDGGDASLFINTDSKSGIVIHIYLKREDVVRDNTR